MMTVSNKHGCFREFLGQRLVGLLFGVMPGGGSLGGTLYGVPVEHRESSDNPTTKTLIFEDGRGLTLGPNDSYWIDSASDILIAIERKQRDIAQQQEELAAQLRNTIVP